MTQPAKHTPGPWTLERDRAKSLSIYAGNTFVGEVYNEVDEPSAQENANAHLIAAAPAMYEALNALVEVFPSVVKMTPYGVTMDISKIHDDAKAALAQAEGKE